MKHKFPNEVESKTCLKLVILAQGGKGIGCCGYTRHRTTMKEIDTNKDYDSGLRHAILPLRVLYTKVLKREKNN